MNSSKKITLTGLVLTARGVLLDVIEHLRRRTASAYTLFWSSENAVMSTSAALVGVSAGTGAVVFRWLIDFFRETAFGGGAEALSFLGPYYVVLIPAIGGLGVGPLVYFFAREAKGHGVPEVMEAVALRGGRIRPVVAVVKSLASSLCIGTGGSVGREGPIVQIGCALGSTLGQNFRLSDERIRTLLACGAAGGIAATFNAPIAGVFFALEVILRKFSTQYFSMVVIAAVTSSIVGRTFIGDTPAFQVPPYSLVGPWELFFYTLLGLLAAFVGSAFIFLLYCTEDLFNAWKFPEYFKPAVGGLGVGILGFYAPEVFGVGYETIEKTLHGEIFTAAMMALVIAKLLATSLTLGSGGSGGVFAPSLFLGSLLGGSFGNLVHQWMPTITASSGAYALVGMGAVFAGAAQAPITAIIILFEMTGDYKIILPLMFATAVSTLVSVWMSKESIYTVKLKRRGVDIDAGQDLNLMRSIRIGEAMTAASDLTTVRLDTSLEELARLFHTSHFQGFAVLDERRDLAGIVALTDLERSLNQNQAARTVGDICTRRLITAYPDEALEDVIAKIGFRDVGRIPVVDRSNPRRLLGMAYRADIIGAYTLGLMDRQKREGQLERIRLEQATSARLLELDLKVGDNAIEKTLGELRIPSDCLIITIRRWGRTVVPRGETEFIAGDHVVALVAPGKEDQLKRCLQ
jgi:chloride channel protein, CIC family